jgi:DNA-binding MarR family transcriptional regulator
MTQSQVPTQPMALETNAVVARNLASPWETRIPSVKQKAAYKDCRVWNLCMVKGFELLSLSPVSFRLPMTRKDIAARLGLTIETVSRLFTILQKQNLIKSESQHFTLTGLRRDKYFCCHA